MVRIPGTFERLSGFTVLTFHSYQIAYGGDTPLPGKGSSVAVKNSDLQMEYRLAGPGCMHGPDWIEGLGSRKGTEAVKRDDGGIRIRHLIRCFGDLDQEEDACS